MPFPMRPISLHRVTQQELTAFELEGTKSLSERPEIVNVEANSLVGDGFAHFMPRYTGWKQG